MNTAKAAYQIAQTAAGTAPDGLPGPRSDAALAALRSAALATPDILWPPQSAPPPVPPPSSGALMVGDDSVEPFTAKWYQLMTELAGIAPKWIGRYIGRGSKPATYQLLASEFAPAAAAGVKFLLIAEQTTSVSGTQPQGYADGQRNAQNIFSLFGAEYLASIGKEFFVSLDVEGSPDMSAAYYEGWAQGLADEAKALSNGRVNLLPCIYASENDGATWKALAAAMKAGAACFGAWVASYVTTSAAKLPIDPTWNPAKARMNTGDDSAPPTCPVLIWQTAGGFQGTPYEALDPDLVNPATDAAAFLARCVIPPTQS